MLKYPNMLEIARYARNSLFNSSKQDPADVSNYRPISNHARTPVKYSEIASTCRFTAVLTEHNILTPHLCGSAL